MSQCRFLITGVGWRKDNEPPALVSVVLSLDALDTLTAQEIQSLVTAWRDNRPVTLTLEAVES